MHNFPNQDINYLTEKIDRFHHLAKTIINE